MILSTSMSQPTVPKLLDPPPGMMSDFGSSFSRSPVDEADQMCSMFMDDYSSPESPGAILGLMDDFGMDSPNKNIWKLLPTPPRSPDHYYYGCNANPPTLIDSGSNAMMGSAGALGQAWAELGLDEEDVPDAPSAEEQEAICAILFEHDDFIEKLLKDENVLDSVLGGSSSTDEIAEVDSMTAVEDWSLPISPTQPAVKSELLHDCMWSGQCTDDCKQKAAREMRQALVATPTSSFDVVVSPESAMPSPDVLVANPVFASSRTIADVTSSRTSIVVDESVATQCVDPSSVLGYTPLSDHSYHQATTSAPPTPPDSPRAVTQQGPASGAGAGSGSAPPLLVVRRRNGVWKREVDVTVSDTPSESDEDDDDEDDEDEEADEKPKVVEEQQQADEDDDEEDDDDEDDDDDDDDDDEEIDVVTVSGERHHGGRHGASAPAVVALPANGSVNAIRCAGRLPRTMVGGASNALASPAVVSRMTSSGRVVTPSHKALTNGQTQRRRRRRGGDLTTATSPPNAGGKRKRSRHHHHHHHHHHHASTPSSPQSKRSRRDEDSSSSSSSSSSSQSSSRRGGHYSSLSQLPPSAKRNEHNTMERKRRDDLRVAFQELREKVPALADNKKAAKVTILNEAANYALQLTYDSCRIDRDKKQEEQRNHVLKRRLAVLVQQQRARNLNRR